MGCCGSLSFLAVITKAHCILLSAKALPGQAGCLNPNGFFVVLRRLREFEDPALFLRWPIWAKWCPRPGNRAWTGRHSSSIDEWGVPGRSSEGATSVTRCLDVMTQATSVPDRGRTAADPVSPLRGMMMNPHVPG